MFENENIFGFLEQQEGIMASVIGNEVAIFISYYSPEPEEIELFKNGPIEFGVGFGLGALIFAYKIGSLDWQDLLYSYNYSQWLHRQEQVMFIEPTVESLGPEDVLSLKMYLIDADTNTLVAKRGFQLPEELKNEVIMGVKEQKYSKVPILNSSSVSTKVQAFEFLRDFLECQPVEDIVEGLKKHTFNC